MGSRVGKRFSVASAVVADQIRVGSWAHEEARRGGARRRDEPVDGCERSGPDEQERAVEMIGRGAFVDEDDADGTYGAEREVAKDDGVAKCGG